MPSAASEDMEEPACTQAPRTLLMATMKESKAFMKSYFLLLLHKCREAERNLLVGMVSCEQIVLFITAS